MLVAKWWLLTKEVHIFRWSLDIFAIPCCADNNFNQLKFDSCHPGPRQWDGPWPRTCSLKEAWRRQSTHSLLPQCKLWTAHALWLDSIAAGSAMLIFAATPCSGASPDSGGKLSKSITCYAGFVAHNVLSNHLYASNSTSIDAAHCHEIWLKLPMTLSCRLASDCNFTSCKIKQTPSNINGFSHLKCGIPFHSIWYSVYSIFVTVLQLTCMNMYDHVWR